VNKLSKKEIAIFYNKILRRFSSIIVFRSKKIDSFNFNILRNYLRVKHCNIILVKNRIFKLLIDTKGNEFSQDLVKGNIMLLYTNNINLVIKNIFSYIKNYNLDPIFSILGKKIYFRSDIIILSKIPNKCEAIKKITTIIYKSARNLLIIFKLPNEKILQILKNKTKQ